MSSSSRNEERKLLLYYLHIIFTESIIFSSFLFDSKPLLLLKEYLRLPVNITLTTFAMPCNLPFVGNCAPPYVSQYDPTLYEYVSL